jgi:hypothetical protein
MINTSMHIVVMKDREIFHVQARALMPHPKLWQIKGIR